MEWGGGGLGPLQRAVSIDQSVNVQCNQCTTCWIKNDKMSKLLLIDVSYHQEALGYIIELLKCVLYIDRV